MQNEIKKIYKKIKNKLIKNKRRSLLLVIVFLILMFIIFIAIISNQQQPKLNKDLISLNQNIEKEIGSGETVGLEELLKKRMGILKSEFIKNPNLIDNYSLLEKIKNKIPNRLTSFLEHRKKIKGEIRAVDAMLDNGTSYINYSLAYTDDGNNQKINELFLKDKESGLLSAKEANVDGLQLDNYMLTSNSQIENEKSTQITENAANNESGKEDRVLIIAALFADKTYQRNNFSKDVRDTIFVKGGVADEFKSESFGKYTLKEAGAVDVVIDSSYEESCTDNWSVWQSEARDMANDLGFDRSKYDKVVVTFIGQNKPCRLMQNGKEVSPSAYGTLGGSDSTYFGIANSRTYKHEMGHNLGLHHASSDYKCDDAGNDCSWNEYGDPISVMGQGYVFSGAERDKLGWINDNNIINLDFADSDGEYTIHKLTQDNINNTSNKFIIKFACDGRKVDKKTGSLADWYVDYCYYQYEGGGKFSKRHTDTYKHHGYTFLDDLNKRNDLSYLSDPEDDLYILGSTKNDIVSQDNDKITLKIRKIQSVFGKITEIKIKTYGSSQQVAEAGVNYDYSDKTYAKSSRYGIFEYLGGLSFKWSGASNDGNFNEKRAGNYSIKASINDIESNTVNILVIPSYFDNTNMVSSNGQDLIVGQETTITANATDKYLNNIKGALYQWTYPENLNATTSDEGSSINFIPDKPGDYKFTAISDIGGVKKEGTINISVKPAQVESINIDPDIDQKNTINETIQFNAYPKDKLGKTIKDAKIIWTGADSTGKFTSNKPGDYQVKASSENGIDSKIININVQPDKLDHINISPDKSLSINVGESVKFTAQGQDKYNNNISNLKYDWTGANANGIYIAKESGIFTIKASSGSINSNSINVLVNDAIKEKPISIPLGNPSLMTLEKNGEELAIPDNNSATNISNTDKIKLSGSMPEKTSVTLYVNSIPYQTTISSDGKWNIELNAKQLNVGPNSITAQSNKGDIKSDATKLLNITVSTASSSGKQPASKTKQPTTNPNQTINNNDNVNILKNPIFIIVSSVILLVAVSWISVIILKKYFSK